MARSRHCDVCDGWHDLDEPWPAACIGHYQTHKEQDAHNVIRDIEPYQSMITGEMITGRAQHRDHLKRHGRREVGNEYEAHTKRTTYQPNRVTETIRAAVQATEQGYRTRVMSRQEFDS